MISCPNCHKEASYKPGRNSCVFCEHEFMLLAPQPGPQTEFLARVDVDIIVYGGAAGGGKSYALLLEPVPDLQNVRGFGAVCFRREIPQITNEGGLFDTANLIYGALGAKPRTNPKLQFTFPNKNRITFTHLQNDDDMYSHQGAQYADILFDELTHFNERPFWYIVGRNRAPGVRCKKRVRATTNPDPGTWVKKFLAPWVEEEYPEELKAKSGEVLYLVRLDGEYNYFKKRKDAMAFAEKKLYLPQHEIEHSVKSVTFIAASIYDNKILMDSDPEYLASLLALNKVERERLLRGNWSITEDSFFDTFRKTTPDGHPWHVIPRTTVPEGYNYVLGVDWGFADPFCALLIAIAPSGRLTVCREVYVTRTLTSNLGEMMIKMMEDVGLERKNVLVYAGHDVFNKRLKANGEYEEPIVATWQRQKLRVVSSGRDPVTRASKLREYLEDWGSDELWFNGRPGIQIMDCCVNLIRTLPNLKNDPNRAEQVDTTMEDHPYDALGHVITSQPSRPKAAKKKEDYDDTRRKGSLRRRMQREYVDLQEGDEYVV